MNSSSHALAHTPRATAWRTTDIYTVPQREAMNELKNFTAGREGVEVVVVSHTPNCTTHALAHALALARVKVNLSYEQCADYLLRNNFDVQQAVQTFYRDNMF